VIEIRGDALRDLARSATLEWIETNGVGGWAASSVSFASTRRYHGMLVAAGEAQRRVVVAKLDETLNGVDLATNFFPGAVHPRGFEHLREFRRGAFPEWIFEAGGVRLRKTVVAPYGENTTIVLYEVLDAPHPFELRLTPFLAGRDYHALRRAGDTPHPALRAVVRGGRFVDAPDWWRDFVYPREVERGLDHVEDLWTPGYHVVTLDRGAVLPVVIAAEERERDALAMIAAERQRRESFDDLSLAADQFIIDTPPGKTVIAGYHWFTDWGRDTMIALPGLCLATGRIDDAKAILRRWIAAMDGGMIPNRFPDGTTEPAYNSVDATLWMFIAVWRLFEIDCDREFAPAVRAAIEAFERGTRFNIHVDDDGLLFAGASGVALTWMDAIVDGNPVTPRRGKPVEINALWYDALRIAAIVCDDQAFNRRADDVKRAFEAAFWNDALGCCFDVVGPNDASIRPNQLFAIALPFPLFDDERAERILRVIDKKLLTPVGLRSLAPGEPGYCGAMLGPQHERDSAYHQGTVWPWLTGAYADAVLRVRGEGGRAAVDRLLDGMERHMTENCVGTICEVFDGDAPHAPRGCVAQAWSVAEILRVRWQRRLSASTSG